MDAGWLCPACRVALAAVDGVVCCAACGFQRRERGGVWEAPAASEPEGYSRERRDWLEAVEGEHFWFPPRRRLLAGILDRFAAPLAGRALDLGCGNGGFLPELAARLPEVVGIDAYRESLARARRRAPKALLIEADVLAVPLAGGRFDLVSALDVLEHVDPARFLAEVARLAAPDGWLLLSVPALPGLWSELDETAGHRCRFRLADLRGRLEAAGWRLAHATHYQFLLLPAVWVSRRLLRRGAQRLEQAPPAPLAWALGAVNRLEVAALRRFRLPWGSSLVVLAQRAT